MGKDKCEAVLDTIQQIRLLLNKYKFTDWDKAFERLADAWRSDREQARVAIRQIFGGIGSFTDLVLQHDGIIPSEDNESLDRLRTKLFSQCR
jgi:hypothetical protein